MVVIPLDHLEQVVSCFLLVRDNQRRLASLHRRLVIEARCEKRRDALLAPLENQRPDLASVFKLLLQPLMNVSLRRIEQKRTNIAVLVLDLQARAGEKLQVIPEPHQADFGRRQSVTQSAPGLAIAATRSSICS